MRGSYRAANSRGGVRAVTSRRCRDTRGRALDGRGGLREDSAPLAERLLLLLLLFLAADAEGRHGPRLEALRGDLLLATSRRCRTCRSRSGRAPCRSWRGGTSRGRAAGRSSTAVYSLDARSISSGRSSVSKLDSSVSVFFAESSSCRFDSSSIVLNFFRSFLFKRPPRSRAPPGARPKKSGETSPRPQGCQAGHRARAECGAASETSPAVDARSGPRPGLQAEALLVRAAGTCSRRMPDGKFDREFLRGALALTARSEVDRLLLVSDHPLSPNEIRGRPIKRKLVYAVTSEGLANQLKARKYTAVLIPPYDYTRDREDQGRGGRRAGGRARARRRHDPRALRTGPRPGGGHARQGGHRLRGSGGEAPGRHARAAARVLVAGGGEPHPHRDGDRRGGLRGAPGRHHPRHRRLDGGDGEEPPAHPEPVPGDQRGGAERARSAHPRGDQDVLRARRRVHHPRGRRGARRRAATSSRCRAT